MITRIKYKKYPFGEMSQAFTINAELIVRAFINYCSIDGVELVILNCSEGTHLHREQCRNIPAAKRKARKILEKLGMNFAVEFRR